jgi:20S proteasome subunit beta 3
MKGANCVAIASDLRFGKELQTVSTDFSKCFEMSPHLWLGLTGLTTDVQTVQQKMEFRMNMYELSESRKMTPKTFAAVLSNMLYERRFGPFFVNPLVAGLDPKTKAPFISSMDVIGNITEPEDFATSGTCEDQLFGKSKSMCNIIWITKVKSREVFVQTPYAMP